MTWTKLGDTYTDMLDLLGLSRSARLLDVEGTVWCNRNTTNGYLPRAALRKVTDSPDPEGDAAELVAAGRWEDVDTGWQLDWSDQETAEAVKARQVYNAQKQQRYRDRKERHSRGDHSACDPRFCQAVTGNATSNVTGLVTDSRPVPTRPVPKGQGTGEEGDDARSAGATRSPCQRESRGHPYEDDGAGVDYCRCGLPRANGVHAEVMAS